MHRMQTAQTPSPHCNLQTYWNTRNTRDRQQYLLHLKYMYYTTIYYTYTIYILYIFNICYICYIRYIVYCICNIQFSFSLLQKLQPQMHIRKGATLAPATIVHLFVPGCRLFRFGNETIFKFRFRVDGWPVSLFSYYCINFVLFFHFYLNAKLWSRMCGLLLPWKILVTVALRWPL